MNGVHIDVAEEPAGRFPTECDDGGRVNTVNLLLEVGCAAL